MNDDGVLRDRLLAIPVFGALQLRIGPIAEGRATLSAPYDSKYVERSLTQELVGRVFAQTRSQSPVERNDDQDDEYTDDEERSCEESLRKPHALRGCAAFNL